MYIYIFNALGVKLHFTLYSESHTKYLKIGSFGLYLFSLLVLWIQFLPWRDHIYTKFKFNIFSQKLLSQPELFWLKTAIFKSLILSYTIKLNFLKLGRILDQDPCLQFRIRQKPRDPTGSATLIIFSTFYQGKINAWVKLSKSSYQ